MLKPDLQPITVFLVVCIVAVVIVVYSMLLTKSPSSEGDFIIQSHYYYDDMIILNAADTLSEGEIIQAFRVSIIERRMWLQYTQNCNADTQERQYSPEDMIQNKGIKPEDYGPQNKDKTH